MTEEEWFQTRSPGVILEAIRRHARFRSEILGRKGRRAACEILRLAIPKLGNPSWLKPIEKTESYIDDACEFRDIEAAVRQADNVQLSRVQTTRGALGLLSNPDPLTAAYAAIWVALSFQCMGQPEVSSDPQLEADAHRICLDIFGNPFRPITFDPQWRTSTAVAMCKGMYESREFSAMPILADALQDAGCENEDVLNHCRDATGTHVRGCWVVDLVLGKA